MPAPAKKQDDVAPAIAESGLPAGDDVARQLCDELRLLYKMDARGLRPEARERLDAIEGKLRAALGA